MKSIENKLNKYYIERFNKVLEYIHLNLDASLDIESLANMVFISSFYFHRLIKLYLGESLGAYIKRIRIESAAKFLKYSENSIADISLDVGFKTQTSFHKSFRKYFNTTPAKFRKNPNVSFASVKKNKEKTNYPIELTRIQIKDFLIITHPSKGELLGSNINNIWERLIKYCNQKNLINKNTKYFGVHWDDPSITEETKLRYDAGVSIDEKIVSEFPVKKIAGGRYFCFNFVGDEKYLGDIYDQIFRDFILKKNIKLRNQPPFEEYVSMGKITKAEERITNIFIPVI